MADRERPTSSIAGQLLVAMPQLGDPRFVRSVIFLVAHTPEGAMGLVVNRLAQSLSFSDLLEQIQIPGPHLRHDIRVHFGGPVETGRGFVLHSSDYFRDSSMRVVGDVALTASVDILHAIVKGEGPKNSILALGYVGWGPGQLDAEIQSNSWLLVSPDDAILFDGDLDTKWQRSVSKLGFDAGQLASEAGRA